VSAVDAFLMRNGFEPTTPVSQVVQQQHQQPQQVQQLPNPNRHGPSGRYFIRDDQLEGPRTSVVEAGRSQFADAVDPMPDRDSFASDMEVRNKLAWEVARLNQQSGSHTTRDPRVQAQEGYEPVVVRDRFGRIRTDYVRRDPAGRPVAQTDVDAGRIRPGGDFF
jgi:hypothetical protein